MQQKTVSSVETMTMQQTQVKLYDDKKKEENSTQRQHMHSVTQGSCLVVAWETCFLINLRKKTFLLLMTLFCGILLLFLLHLALFI